MAQFPSRPNATLITLDTEFIEDGVTIDLLSIGMVRSDGLEYYAEPAEADHSKASDWVATNVLPHLEGRTKPRAQIRDEIILFAGHSPEFWGWYADYDWVALCQLHGTMMQLPGRWPMFCRDFRQVTSGIELPKQSVRIDGPEHHALSDARWLMRAMRWHAEQEVT